jgi:hypothetical protein
MYRLLTGLMFLFASLGTFAQAPALVRATDPLAPLDFLIGTWAAVTDTAAGTSGGTNVGNYTFRRDLNGHAIDRTGATESCKGPEGFDCFHHDRLTIFSDPGALSAHHTSILAFYQDNEGHVIYYAVSTPDPHTAVFLSQSAPGTPKFRLTYHLEGNGPKAVMTGKFQMAAPGSEEYHSYLEWSGTRQ